MTITEAKATIYANVVYACEKAGLAPQTTRLVQDACDTIIALADACETIVALADRKTSNCSEIPNNCETQTETKTKTQNSNLTFKKRTMRDCYNCKRYETEGECIECHYDPKDEPQTERSE